MLYRLVLALMLLLTSLIAQAQLPARDLVVELRQLDEGVAGYSVSTQPREARMAPQRLQVRNGTKAVFSMTQSVPFQWVQSAFAQSVTRNASAASASSRSGGVSHAVTWMDSGQKITVLPRWSGGQQPVTVEVEVQGAAIQQRNGAELPAQTRSLLVTTVTAPPGLWVTLATVGGSATASGVYSSESAADAHSLLQIRVSTP